VCFSVNRNQRSPATRTFLEAPLKTWTYTKTFYCAPKKKEGVLGRVGRYIATGSPYDRIEESVLKVMFDDQGIVTGHTFSTSVAGVRD
jgi:hypothetical protein